MAVRHRLAHTAESAWANRPTDRGRVSGPSIPDAANRVGGQFYQEIVDGGRVRPRPGVRRCDSVCSVVDDHCGRRPRIAGCDRCGRGHRPGVRGRRRSSSSRSSARVAVRTFRPTKPCRSRNFLVLHPTVRVLSLLEEREGRGLTVVFPLRHECSQLGLWAANAWYGVEWFAPPPLASQRLNEPPFFVGLDAMVSCGGVTASHICSRTCRGIRC